MIITNILKDIVTQESQIKALEDEQSMLIAKLEAERKKLSSAKNILIWYKTAVERFAENTGAEVKLNLVNTRTSAPVFLHEHLETLRSMFLDNGFTIEENEFLVVRFKK